MTDEFATSGTRGDLPWSAYRYVADEMSPEETAEFELQLQHDQSTREALAQAVELMGAVAVAEQRVPAPTKLVGLHATRRDNWRRHLMRVAIGTVAVATVLLVSYQAIESPDKPRQSRVPQVATAADAPELAVAWSGILERWDTDSQASESNLLNTMNEAEWVQQLVEESANVDAFRSPSWMLAAVEGMSAPGTSNKKQPPDAID